MKMIKFITTVVLLMASQLACADLATDGTQIRSLATRWETAWNTHDMQALANLFTHDADFVNVAGHHWKGRQTIEAEHVQRLPQFKESVWTTTGVDIQYLQPDIALSHVQWAMHGDTDPDGAPRKPREGIFTWVVMRQRGHWLIRSAQNTNLNNPSIVSK